MTKNGLSFAGSQTLLASENEVNSTGNFNATETLEDPCRLIKCGTNYVYACFVVVQF